MFTLNIPSPALKHVFNGPSFPTPVPVRGSMKPITAISDSLPSLLQLRAEHLITLHIRLKTDTQIRITLHFTPLGISFSPFGTQPSAFLVLETINLRYN